MRVRSLLLAALMFGPCSSLHAVGDIIDSDVIDGYLYTAFSSMKVLTVHEDLIKKGYLWDGVAYCHSPDGEDTGDYWITLGLTYKKGERVKTLVVEVHSNPKAGIKKITKVEFSKDSDQ